jgi:hypothetical protein
MRLEWLPAPTFEWRTARHWFWPLTLLVGVSVLYLMQSSFATTSELEITRLLKERDAIARRNAQLTAEIAQLEKPSRIRERAFTLGLADMSKSTLIRLDVPNSVPDASLAAPLSLPYGAQRATHTMTLWQPYVDEFVRWTKQATTQMELLSP